MFFFKMQLVKNKQKKLSKNIFLINIGDKSNQDKKKAFCLFVSFLFVCLHIMLTYIRLILGCFRFQFIQEYVERTLTWQDTVNMVPAITR